MGNQVTTEQSNNPRQLNSNVTTEQRDKPRQLSSNVTTEQRDKPRQLSSNVTTEQRDKPRQLSSNVTTEQRNKPRQLSSNVTTEPEKCYDPQDKTLTFIDGEDDLDFECNEYKSLRAKMSCGHAVTPMSLTDWCRRLLDQGKCRFVCGQPGCDVEWPFEEVCKMALLSPEEMEYFEQKMFNNAGDLNSKLCPGCKSSVVRTDLSDLSTECSVCTANKKRSYRFCWQCLKEWKGPAPRSDRCENDGCINQQLEILRISPDIVFENVKGVTGCPSIRACPTCGLLLEHNKTQCKTIICRRCKVKFCFVCLKLTGVCQKPYGLCSTGVAPRQTSIPVWQRKLFC